MKIILSLICMSLTLPLLRADDQAKQVKIEALLTATHVSEMLAQQQGQLRTTLHDLIVRSAPSLDGTMLLRQLEETTVSEVAAATS